MTQRVGDILQAFRSLPMAGADWVSNHQPILILAPHPDDESLGCGGLIAAAGMMAIDVRVAVLTDGAASHPNSRTYPRPRLMALREAEVCAAVAELGLDPGWVSFLDLPDSMVGLPDPRVDEAVARLVDLVAEHEIGTICATWPYDPHRDHLLAHHVAAAVVRGTGIRHLSYPVWGWTLPPAQLLPDLAISGRRIDIARFLPAKRRAIAAHASQMGLVIDDDPSGFSVPEALLSNFDQPYEVFLEVT